MLLPHHHEYQSGQHQAAEHDDEGRGPDFNGVQQDDFFIRQGNEDQRRYSYVKRDIDNGGDADFSQSAHEIADEDDKERGKDYLDDIQLRYWVTPNTVFEWPWAIKSLKEQQLLCHFPY